MNTSPKTASPRRRHNGIPFLKKRHESPRRMIRRLRRSVWKQERDEAFAKAFAKAHTTAKKKPKTFRDVVAAAKRFLTEGVTV